MASTEIVLTSPDLIKFFPTFGTIKPDWPQQIAVIYMVGKKDPMWSGGSDAAGLTVQATQDATMHRFLGTILIDIESLRDDTKVGSLVGRPSQESPTVDLQINFSNPSLRDVRRKTVETLVHELLHVLQGWVRPGGYEDADRTALPKARGKDLFVRHPAEFAFMRYSGNVYERAAFSRAFEFVGKHAAGIDAGEYDAYLPISMLQDLLKHQPPTSSPTRP